MDALRICYIVASLKAVRARMCCVATIPVVTALN
jgi:hypothetical protein